MKAANGKNHMTDVSFSLTNLGYMRRFYLLYSPIYSQVGGKSKLGKISPQVEGELFQINNAIKEGEVESNVVVKDSLTTTLDGKRYITDKKGN